MLLEDNVVLTFFHEWSEYSANYGIHYFKEAEDFFRIQKNIAEINFWLADVSDGRSPAIFLRDWIENNSVKQNLFTWIGAGNPSVIWLNRGQILKCEFSAYILKSKGIIENTIEIFELRR